MTDPRGVCAQRAEDLASNLPYVRGWSTAKRGADALAEQLRALGLEHDFPGLKAAVNAFGDGVVCLGTIRPETAAILATLIASGLALEMAEQAESDSSLSSNASTA